MPEQSGIYFKDEGKGFPVLLIHGFCETHQVWDSFSGKLASEYRVLSIDLPGFGKSPLLNIPFSLEEVAAKVLEWLKAVQVSPCVVIGHSLGGYVALAMVGQQPHIFKGFSLFHSTAYPDSEEKKFSRNKVIEFVSKNGVAPFIESFIPPLFYDQSSPDIPVVVELARGTRKETLLSYAGAMRDRPDHTDVLENFTGSILFIAGKKDTVVSPEAMENQSKMAAKPVLHVMERVAHMGMFENESKALDLTLSFLVSNCQ